MAWIDDRIYAHHRVLSVSKPARWTFVAACAYCSGWGTGGHLTKGALEAIGCDRKLLRELVDADLFEPVDGGWSVRGWAEHNSHRDARRAADRERKRAARSAGRPQSVRRTSAGHDADKVRSGARAAHVDGSEGSEEEPRAVTSKADPTRANGEQPYDFNIDDLFPDPILKDIP